jgi:NAD(P)H-dependent flavin oxidoreductase YrpB (nitropropane dioxygenase family)
MPDSRRVTPRTYRLVDTLTKVAGVALVAAGLQVGGDTATGLALGAAGAALGVSTVFVSTDD